MGRESAPSGSAVQVFKRLMSDNRRDIDEYNITTLSTLLFIGWVLTLLPLAAVPFSNTKHSAIPAYLLSFSTFLVLFFLFKLPVIKKHSLVGLYIGFSVLFVLGIYLSIIHSPDMRANNFAGRICCYAAELYRHAQTYHTVFVFVVSNPYRTGILLQTTVCA